MGIPMPTEATSIDEIARLLEAASFEEQVAWARSLNGKQQYALYAMCEGRAVKTAELIGPHHEIVRLHGRNGLPITAFSWFEKRIADMGDEVGGYNFNLFPGLLSKLAAWVTGPGHFVMYDSPEVPGEVWIDYRRVLKTQHPEKPPLVDNEHGTRALVYGDMVDVLRRVGGSVFIGDSFKGRFPRDDRPGFLCRLGKLFGTAPFVVVRQAP